MKYVNKKVMYLLFICLCVSCNQQKSPKNKSITIAVASNMQFAIKNIVNEFTKETEVDCNIIIGSSGKLTAQILKGAPFDIFLSANMKYPLEICKQNITYKNTPKIYAYGKMVLWSCYDDISININSLDNKIIKHIGIANPKTAPYGVSASEAISNLDSKNNLTPKLIYGESISQINQFVSLKTVELGFTSKSTVLSPKMKNKGKWIDVDQNLYTPIKQGIIIIKNDSIINPDAIRFYDFLSSNKAKKILQSSGYDISPTLK